jgi:hypothetical protein
MFPAFRLAIFNSDGTPSMDANGQPVQKDYTPVLDQATGKYMYKVSIAPDTLLHQTPSSTPGSAVSAPHVVRGAAAAKAALPPPKSGQ